ncbi:MAG: UDP-N-acetylmuramoylalanyl-D-glutamyl-2,6-diaminopimelate--D-alanyl-D-alanyl ligase [Rickettsiaceae bacterium]|jgi:UDP-N-acetylmuramoyl-tripeptide--D-alanyl-D-alanine ligase|nr:UDP-N-acetylmuramoylalanyl-D-glutamyl-2,6-diaminopimelate--D-alanyl-D-alanyl ligase [Rickettsiaceae bacterium]
MYIWDAKILSEALKVSLNDKIKTTFIEFDSRAINGGELFIALTGGVSDGHLYVKDALQNGAAAAIVSHIPEGIDKDKLILVDDTYQALLKLAEYKRNNSKAKFVGITGSVGKTSTKNAIFTALNACGKAFFTRGNFNNHLGLPINLASMPDDIEFAVIEMGMNHAKEISALTKMARPDIAIITNIEAAHIGNLGSMEAICDAKCEIFEGVSKGGEAILNIDSPFYEKMKEAVKKQNIQHIYTFSQKEQGDANLLKASQHGTFMEAEYEIMGQKISLKTGITGEHQALNISIALLVTKILKLDLKKAAKALEQLKPEKGRGLPISLKLLSSKEIIVVNDSYNASAPAVIAAFKNIANISGKRKIAVLSNMNELGNFTQEIHESLAGPVLENKLDLVLTVGDYMRYLHNILPKNIAVKHYDNMEQLKAGIYNYLEDGDVVLFKGSKGTKLHVFVEEFINQNKTENAL